MHCPKCRSTPVKERPERTTQGYRRFRCLDCTKQFNERMSTDPVCVDSEQISPIDPHIGPILLDLRVNFGNTADRIVVRGLGLHLVA